MLIIVTSVNENNSPTFLFLLGKRMLITVTSVNNSPIFMIHIPSFSIYGSNDLFAKTSDTFN